LKVNALMIKPADNVATAIVELKKDEIANFKVGDELKSLKVLEDIPFGFKICTRDIKAGEPVLKYGMQIGLASKDIKPGVVVHIHNCEGARGRGDLNK